MDQEIIKQSKQKVDDMILYLAYKYKLPEKQIRNIVLGQFKFIKKGIITGTLQNYSLIQFGKFLFRKDYYPKIFQLVCENDWKNEQLKQSIRPW